MNREGGICGEVVKMTAVHQDKRKAKNYTLVPPPCGEALHRKGSALPPKPWVAGCSAQAEAPASGTVEGASAEAEVGSVSSVLGASCSPSGSR